MIEIKSGGIYRSLHYIIKYRGYYVEIQARTLFEEGWSEVDHDIVYPYHKDDVMLRDFSRLLNRLSGMADEMSSYFRRMKVEKEFEEVLLGEYKEDKEAEAAHKYAGAAGERRTIRNREKITGSKNRHWNACYPHSGG